MLTVEYWHNGQLLMTKTLGRKSSLEYVRIYNRMAERRQIAGRWIIASNGLRN